MIFLIIYIYNLLNDYNRLTIFKHMHIFKIMQNYYLIKYKYFIYWKNSMYLIFLLNIYFKNKKYFIIINIIILIINSLGHWFFCENLYDLFFSPIDLSDKTYKDLEPSFNVTDPELTSQIPSEMKHNKVQKDLNLYIIVFFVVSFYIINNMK